MDTRWLITSFLFFLGFSWCICAVSVYRYDGGHRATITKFLQWLSLLATIICAFYYWQGSPFDNMMWGLVAFHMIVLVIVAFPGLQEFLADGPQAVRTQPFAGFAIFLTVIFFWVVLYLILQPR